MLFPGEVSLRRLFTGLLCSQAYQQSDMVERNTMYPAHMHFILLVQGHFFPKTLSRLSNLWTFLQRNQEIPEEHRAAAQEGALPEACQRDHPEPEQEQHLAVEGGRSGRVARGRRVFSHPEAGRRQPLCYPCRTSHNNVRFLATS